ncbi:hypothetical protein COOONC_16161 [Cooperia oncophora]
MVVSIHAVADTLTFIRMTCHNRKDPNIVSNSAEQRKRRRVERRFVKQVALQGVVFVTELVSYFYVDDFFPLTKKDDLERDPNRWPNFLCTTFAWILVPLFDG